MFIKNLIEFFHFLRVQRYNFFSYGACFEKKFFFFGATRVYFVFSLRNCSVVLTT